MTDMCCSIFLILLALLGVVFFFQFLSGQEPFGSNAKG